MSSNSFFFSFPLPFSLFCPKAGREKLSLRTVWVLDSGKGKRKTKGANDSLDFLWDYRRINSLNRAMSVSGLRLLPIRRFWSRETWRIL